MLPPRIYDFSGVEYAVSMEVLRIYCNIERRHKDPLIAEDRSFVPGCFLCQSFSDQTCKGGPMSEQNKALARRFYDEVMNKKNLGAIDELGSPEFVDHSLKLPAA
jgi:hypothetical protein